MTEYKVTVTGETGSISYIVFKTEKGAKGFGSKIAREAFHGEEAKIEVVSL